MAKEIHVPDIGDFSEVDVIEVLVNAGDTVSIDDALITLESDKASMEIPAPQAGRVKELKVGVGDKVSEGSLILILEADEVVATDSAGTDKTAVSETSDPDTVTPTAAPIAKSYEALF